MLIIPGATFDEVGFVLSHFYAGMLYRMTGTDYDSLIVVPESPIPKPPMNEIRSHIPEARILIAARDARNLKEDRFDRAYPPFDREIATIRAIVSGDTTELAAMLARWDST